MTNEQLAQAIYTNLEKSFKVIINKGAETRLKEIILEKVVKVKNSGDARMQDDQFVINGLTHALEKRRI